MPDPLLHLTPSHEHALRDQRVWCQIAVSAPAAERRSGTRRPVDAVVVLDRSGSMGAGPGSKLEHAKHAAEILCSRLGAGDRVAVVSYDDEVRVDCPLTSDTSDARRALWQIAPGGMTALAPALYLGLDLVGCSHGADRQRLVFLLSDGHANVGDTDPAQIAPRVVAAARAGVRVATFGLGAGFNEHLMERIATAGGGGYWFLDSPERAAAAFAAELDGLAFATVREATLRLTPARGVHIARVLGVDAADPAALTLGDVAAGEIRRVLVECELRARTLGRRNLLACELAYVDAGGSAATASANAATTLTDVEAAVATGLDHEVIARVAELEAADAERRAADLADAGDIAGARAVIGRQADALHAVAAAAPCAAQVLEDKLADYAGHAAALQSDRSWDAGAAKRARYSSYLSRSGRDRQRRA